MGHPADVIIIPGIGTIREGPRLFQREVKGEYGTQAHDNASCW
jgi:hypothetical protein